MAPGPERSGCTYANFGESQGRFVLSCRAERPPPLVMSSEARRSRDIWPRTLRSLIWEPASRPEGFPARPMGPGANARHGSFAARSLHSGLRPPVEMTRRGMEGILRPAAIDLACPTRHHAGGVNTVQTSLALAAYIFRNPLSGWGETDLSSSSILVKYG